MQNKLEELGKLILAAHLELHQTDVLGFELAQSEEFVADCCVIFSWSM